ncbi:retrotransposon-related protein [Tanacetum coccineum]|uniref:Retrotransposon-related protein n=1 Tax=Tanacetum coccineum TaxID=301880 RepID=A0ABQ5EMV1_9ASTR
MAPATRSIVGTSNNEDGGVNERLSSLEASLERVTRALQEMVTMNQGMNVHGRASNQNQFTRMTKVEFPKFSGDDVKGWIFRCEQFFSIDEIPENQKVKLISVHLFDTALLWHRQFIRLNGENVTWNVYKNGILQRFGTVFDDSISEIRKIKYQSNAKDYQDAFDTLLSRVDISEEHAVSFYLGGLPPEIEMGVRMFKPTTLADAYQLTNYQEATLEAVRKKNKAVVNSQMGRFGSGNSGYGNNSRPSLLPLPVTTTNWRTKPNTPATTSVRKQLTHKELDDKRSKNQCFYCDQKYVPGHKCSGRLYSLEIIEGNSDKGENLDEQFDEGVFGSEDNAVENVSEDLHDCALEPDTVTQPQISLNAISGVNTFQTMRIKGQINNNNHVCKGVTWKLQGEAFQADMMLIPLGGCEMVLGVQWLATLGDIVCNFLQLRMEFMYQGRKVVLRGIPQPAMQWMQGKQIGSKLFSMTLCVYPSSSGVQAEFMSTGVSSESTNVHPSLIPLLHRYEKVFAVPKSLPPNRKHDHRIPLQENTSPINIRPYRHPPIQKDAIEAMVNELLDSGVIRESHSPFSSPIVMVKKKDGTWRMCVDYRALNKKTVKDKFPIPIIEELIDELFGAQVFTKLDLSFQALMNEVFAPFLRKFVLVFFDDILVFSKDMTEHAKHLELVLDTMESQQLYAKMSKCVFGTTQVEYLGHVISGKGVSTDSTKVQVMRDWPTPVNIKKLRGFLGLTGYYRRFIKNYAAISRPLTALLKKNSFEWSDLAQQAFDNLKEAMSNAPVLALPNFQQAFVVETDASEEGIGAVLQQNGHPIAFLSRSLAPRHKGLSTYEKELWAVVYALEKWRGYLLGRHFKIKTDHFSLKYLMEQRLSTPFQIKWLPKLLGYDYEILYKKGSENIVADALSRSSLPSLQSMIVSEISNDLLQRIQASWVTDLSIQQIIQKVNDEGNVESKFSWQDEQLRRHGRLVIGNNAQLRSELLKYYHNEPLGGHSGCHKPDLAPYPGLLQPLPIPTNIWTDISMDFIESLPSSHGKTVIMVVVDRLSKYAHFVPMAHPFKAAQVAQLFLDTIYKLHGLPHTITRDRDKVFISHFWKELFKKLGVTLQLSSASIPPGQLDHTTVKAPTHVSYMAGDSHVEAVDRSLVAREAVKLEDIGKLEEAARVLKIKLQQVTGKAIEETAVTVLRLYQNQNYRLTHFEERSRLSSPSSPKFIFFNIKVSRTGESQANFAGCTIFNEMAIEIDMEAYEAMEKPMTIAITSCRVRRYGGSMTTSFQIRGIPGDLSLGIGFPGDLSPGICRAEKLEGDTFPGDLPGRHRGAHTVSVKQIFATVKVFPGRHVARDTKFIK